MLDQALIDQLRANNIPVQGHFINGQSVNAEDEQRIDVISPIDGSVLTQIAKGTAADMHRGIQAAREAYDDGRWSRLAPAARKKILIKLSDLIEEHAVELTVLGVRDNGTEFSMALKGEALSAANTFRYYAESIDKVYGEIAPTADNVLGLIHRTPIGVVGAIVPWNFPMMIGSWKVAPALAAGNSVVLKPPESPVCQTVFLTL